MMSRDKYTAQMLRLMREMAKMQDIKHKCTKRSGSTFHDSVADQAIECLKYIITVLPDLAQLAHPSAAFKASPQYQRTIERWNKFQEEYPGKKEKVLREFGKIIVI